MSGNVDVCESCMHTTPTTQLRYVKAQEGEFANEKAMAHVDGRLYLCSNCRSLRKGGHV